MFISDYQEIFVCDSVPSLETISAYMSSLPRSLSRVPMIATIIRVRMKQTHRDPVCIKRVLAIESSTLWPLLSRKPVSATTATPCPVDQGIRS